MARESSDYDVKVLGEREVKRRLRAMQRRAQDLSPAFREFGDVFRLHNEAHFATEGRQGLGRRWSPLTPRYAAWKLRTTGPQPILTLTGALRRSLTGTRMAIEHVGPRHAEYGTDDPKAVWHQRGTRHMVARPVMVVTRGLREELDRLVLAHVIGDD